MNGVACESQQLCAICSDKVDVRLHKLCINVKYLKSCDGYIQFELNWILKKNWLMHFNDQQYFCTGCVVKIRSILFLKQQLLKLLANSYQDKDLFDEVEILQRNITILNVDVSDDVSASDHSMLPGVESCVPENRDNGADYNRHRMQSNDVDGPLDISLNLNQSTSNVGLNSYQYPASASSYSLNIDEQPLNYHQQTPVLIGNASLVTDDIEIHNEPLDYHQQTSTAGVMEQDFLTDTSQAAISSSELIHHALLDNNAQMVQPLNYHLQTSSCDNVGVHLTCAADTVQASCNKPSPSDGSVANSTSGHCVNDRLIDCHRQTLSENDDGNVIKNGNSSEIADKVEPKSGAPRSFACSHCPMTFAKKIRLQEHERIHVSDKAYICSFCGKQLHRLAELHKHERLHTGERPYECQKCSETFRILSQLQRHEREHTGEQDVCEICGKTYMSRDSYYRHRLKHSRRFLCSKCDFSTDVEENFKKHESLHTKKRRYMCDVCNKSFLRKEHLTRHRRIHTGETPFGCRQCGKSFAQSQDLTRHERTHSESKPYACDICNKSLSSKRSFRSHLKTHEFVAGENDLDDRPKEIDRRESKKIETVVDKDASPARMKDYADQTYELSSATVNGQINDGLLQDTQEFQISLIKLVDDSPALTANGDNQAVVCDAVGFQNESHDLTMPENLKIENGAYGINLCTSDIITSGGGNLFSDINGDNCGTNSGRVLQQTPLNNFVPNLNVSNYILNYSLQPNNQTVEHSYDINGIDYTYQPDTADILDLSGVDSAVMDSMMP